MNGSANAQVRAATAEVARHFGVDIGVGRRGIALEQCGGLHDLAGLTVTALRNVVFDPSFLQRVQMLGVSSEAFDCGDRLADGGDGGEGAGADGVAGEVHSARTTERHAAAVFGANESEVVA